jgi:hypothetical protein
MAKSRSSRSEGRSSVFEKRQKGGKKRLSSEKVWKAISNKEDVSKEEVDRLQDAFGNHFKESAQNYADNHLEVDSLQYRFFNLMMAQIVDLMRHHSTEGFFVPMKDKIAIVEILTMKQSQLYAQREIHFRHVYSYDDFFKHLSNLASNPGDFMEKALKDSTIQPYSLDLILLGTFFSSLRKIDFAYLDTERKRELEKVILPTYTFLESFEHRGQE